MSSYLQSIGTCRSIQRHAHYFHKAIEEPQTHHMTMHVSRNISESLWRFAVDVKKGKGKFIQLSHIMWVNSPT